MKADSRFDSTLTVVMKRLNLKPHVVGDKVLRVAGDVEGHLGT